MLNTVIQIVNRIDMNLFDKDFFIRVERDCNDKQNGRIFIQITYNSKCNKSGELQKWSGRKWYLSDFMTEDEIIKTCFSAYKSVVEHEIMETFKVDGIVLFNPHVNYEELLKISNKEIKRL